ncbi:MAG: hypothetical protein R2750_14470 [Bacteroidales bacterium]
MIRIGIIALALSFLITGCNGQTKQETKNRKTDASNPETNIRVNKEYDENGNLIRYDSSYSYFYSNIENDTTLEDSVFLNFRNYFNNRYRFSNEPFFDNYFFEDSLLHYDFFKHDFFSNRFRRNMEYMDLLFREMDSMKNSFFDRQFPNPDLDDLDGNE